MSYRGEPIESFLHQYGRASKRIHSNNEGSLAEQSLATVWEVQFDQIRSSPAAKILGFISILAPDSIPVCLFIPDDDDEWDEIISEIVGYSENE